jgi:hypothetical protein
VARSDIVPEFRGLRHRLVMVRKPSRGEPEHRGEVGSACCLPQRRGARDLVDQPGEGMPDGNTVGLLWFSSMITMILLTRCADSLSLAAAGFRRRRVPHLCGPERAAGLGCGRVTGTKPLL